MISNLANSWDLLEKEGAELLLGRDLHATGIVELDVLRLVEDSRLNLIRTLFIILSRLRC